MRDADVTGDCLSGLPRRCAVRNDGWLIEMPFNYL
jgi:hypothetical protein